jgi:hypothetical protein
METTIRDLLIEQVTTHLKTVPVTERVRELIYSHFLSQCNQFDIAEYDFYKEILKPAFRQAEPAPEEDPDPPNRKGTWVKIFGVTLHSLKRLGEVLFEEPIREKIYFEDGTLLKAHVDQLEDADTAIEYTALYKSENEPEKRYLKICYRLNPGLPYRIDKKLFDSLEDLLSAGFKSRALMNMIYRDYSFGKLHIWLHARDLERFSSAPADQTELSFLTFIFTINVAYPFYIKQMLFYSTDDLVIKAQNDINFWTDLATYCENGYLWVWFNALGHNDWIEKLRRLVLDLKQSDTTEKDEKTYTLIQQLIHTINADTVRPLIELSEEKVEMLDLADTGTIDVPLKLSLKTLGYVKVQLTLDAEQEGIWLDASDITLFDLTGKKEAFITLHIEPMKLIKDTRYDATLQVTTEYEILTIPITVQTVFPMRTYLLYIAKYAGIGGLLFGLLRWMISAGTSRDSMLEPRIVTYEIERSLPDNWSVFFWVFLAMLASLIGSYFLIRKEEKI